MAGGPLAEEVFREDSSAGSVRSRRTDLSHLTPSSVNCGQHEICVLTSSAQLESLIFPDTGCETSQDKRLLMPHV